MPNGLINIGFVTRAPSTDAAASSSVENTTTTTDNAENLSSSITVITSTANISETVTTAQITLHRLVEIAKKVSDPNSTRSSIQKEICHMGRFDERRDNKRRDSETEEGPKAKLLRQYAEYLLADLNENSLTTEEQFDQKASIIKRIMDSVAPEDRHLFEIENGRNTRTNAKAGSKFVKGKTVLYVKNKPVAELRCEDPFKPVKPQEESKTGTNDEPVTSITTMDSHLPALEKTDIFHLNNIEFVNLSSGSTTNNLNVHDDQTELARLSQERQYMATQATKIIDKAIKDERIVQQQQSTTVQQQQSTTVQPPVATKQELARFVDLTTYQQQQQLKQIVQQRRGLADQYDRLSRAQQLFSPSSMIEDGRTKSSPNIHFSAYATKQPVQQQLYRQPSNSSIQQNNIDPTSDTDSQQGGAEPVSTKKKSRGHRIWSAAKKFVTGNNKPIVVSPGYQRRPESRPTVIVFQENAAAGITTNRDNRQRFIQQQSELKPNE